MNKIENMQQKVDVKLYKDFNLENFLKLHKRYMLEIELYIKSFGKLFGDYFVEMFSDLAFL